MQLAVLMVTRGVVPISSRCGGAERVALQLAGAMAVDGQRVTLVTDLEAGVAAPPGVRIVGIGARRTRRVIRSMPGGFVRWLLQHLVGNLSVTWTVWQLLRRDRERFDVVHAHGNLSALLLTWVTRTPVIYTEHDSTPWMCRYRHRAERLVRRAVYRSINVSACRRAARVVVNFPALRCELVDRWHVPDASTLCIPNGVDAAQFAERPVPTAQAPRLPFERYCLFVGTMEQRKAPDLLLDALVEAPDVNCVFVGDGPLLSRMRRRAEDLALSARTVFTGALPPSEVASFFGAADFLVQPSSSEGSPLVVLEALATRTPILATRVGGVPSYVDDWQTGFLVKAGDVGQLAMGMRFLHGDDALRARMADACQLRAQGLSWTAIQAGYVEMYADAITPRAAELPMRVEAMIPAQRTAAEDLSVDLPADVRVVVHG